MADLKRSLDIEAALRWAFRDELPKVGAMNRDEVDQPRASTFVASEAGTVSNDVQLMMSLSTNCFGVLPAIGVRGSAHPDAIVIGDAVAALDGMVMGVPEDWKPLAEMDDLSPEVTRLVQATVDRVGGEIEGGRRLFGMRPSFIVQRYALADEAPDWRAEVPAVKVASTPNGQPMWFVKRLQWSRTSDGRDVSHEIEENGYNQRSKRPYGDAYRKLFLSPDPTPAICARAEYELWHAALDALTQDLAPRLSTIRLLPTRRPARPWVDDTGAPSVLPDLADMGPLPPLASRRVSATSPRRRIPSSPRKASAHVSAAH